ncbi:VOC family protein [Paenibacillus donghaensis]|uniref:Glyoxalase n=1 Tax=Paenibacillus donghaensis TaxID=414771 RepID=A0A2Z2KSX9_9BACL|nr:VOC family protein [Paenibacillus donghaensis]ASA24772.1 glyoxalase [Paenibacillus donghaensis]
MRSSGIQKVGQVGIPVRDLKRATDFYQEVLGFPLLFEAGSMAFLECNGLRLMLSLPEQEQYAYSSSVLYFHVEHILSSYADLTEKGVHFTGEPHLVAKSGQTETWMAFFQDTEGNTHALMSESAATQAEMASPSF